MSSKNLKRRGSLESLQTLSKVPKIKDDDQVINFEEKLDDNLETKEFKANTKVCTYFRYSNLQTDYISRDFQLSKKIDDSKAQIDVLETSRDNSEAANKEFKAKTKVCNFLEYSNLQPDYISRDFRFNNNVLLSLEVINMEVINKYTGEKLNLFSKFENRYQCSICSVSIDGVKSINQHLNGKKHRYFMSSYLKADPKPHVEMTRHQELEIKVCNLEKQVVSLQEKEKFWRELYLASNRNENIRDSIEFEDFNSPMKTENFKPKVEGDMKVKIEADIKAEIEVKPKKEMDHNIKIEPIDEINHGMEIILASNRNDFGIDNQVQNIRNIIRFEEFDSPMKTESKENFKPKLEADMIVKTEADVKTEIEVKPKVELDNKVKIEPLEEIYQGMKIITNSLTYDVLTSNGISDQNCV